MGSWNMQQHRDSDLFCFGGGRICGVFPPLLRFGAEHPHLPLFLLHIRTASFEPIKNLAILWGFPPLLHFGAEHLHLPLFLLHIRTASFEPFKNLAILDAQKFQVFDGNPLYHCYNLIYM